MNTESSNNSIEKEYSSLKLKLSIVSIIIDIILISILAFSGIAGFFENFTAITANEYLHFLLFAGIIGVVLSAITFPLDFYSSYMVEHRYSLSNQSVFDWMLEKIKSTLVSLVIGIPIALVFYLFLRISGSLWWLYFSAFIFIIAVLLAKIAPVLIFPIFYKFTPLENEELKQRIEELAKESSISLKGIFTFNMSKETKKANAAFTGLGRTKRIILSDTLVENFTADEISVIFAHELGHYEKKHILKNLVMSGIIIFASFYICGLVYEKIMAIMSFASVYQLQALPLLFFFLTVFSLIMMPLTNFVSRKYEREADAFALEKTGDCGSFISSMEKLSKLNLADADPHPAAEFFLYSHPSLKKRIAFGREYKNTDNTGC